MMVLHITLRTYEEDSDSPGFFATLVVLLMAKAPDCDQWDTADYFKNATVEGVTACLAAGAAPMARDEDEETPLHDAAAFNINPAVIEALLEDGARDYWNAPHCARPGGHWQLPWPRDASRSQAAFISRCLASICSGVEELSVAIAHCAPAA